MLNNFLFFDVDGTLKDPHTQQVPAGASAAVKKAQAEGCLAFICSGRPHFLVKEDFGFAPNGIIFASGGGFELGGRVVLSRVFSKVMTIAIIEKAVECRVGWNLQCFAKGYADERFRKAVEAGMARDHGTGFWTEEHYRQMCVPYEEYRGEPVYKMDVRYFEDSEKQRFLSFLKGKCEYAAQNSMGSIGELGAEISPIDVDKGTGVLMVVTHYHGDMEKTYGFGDSMNDYAMLAACKHGTAMRSGNPKLFDIADYVTDAPWEDGIAKALKHYRLIQED